LAKAGELWRPRYKVWFSFGGFVIKSLIVSHTNYVLDLIGPHFVARRISKVCTSVLSSGTQDFGVTTMLELAEPETKEQAILTLELVLAGGYHAFCRAVHVENALDLISKEVTRLTKELMEIS
jgi:hypothetical protein